MVKRTNEKDVRRPEDWFSPVPPSVGITTGTNTGDQTSIVGISGTKAQFNPALTDGDFLYVGDITQYTDEMSRDALGIALVAGANITITVNDVADTITIAAAAGGSSEGSRAVPLAANFTLQNVGTDTITNTTYALDFVGPSVASQIRFIRKNGAPPAAPYNITIRGQHSSPIMGNGYGLCVILRNNTSGRIIIFGDYQNNQLLVQNWTAYNAWSADVVAPISRPLLLDTPWRRVRNDGTTLFYEISPDKVIWDLIGSSTIASFITATGGTIDEIGFGSMINGTRIRTAFQSFEAA